MDELIYKIKFLKQIEPNKEWAILTKIKVFESSDSHRDISVIPVRRISVIAVISAIFSPSYRKGFAYSSAFVLLLVAGMLGFAQRTLPGDPLFAVKKITEHSQFALSGDSEVQNSVVNFKNRFHDLEKVLSNQKAGNLSSAKKEIKDATKELANAIQASAKQTDVKEIAMEIKNNQVLLSFFEDYELKQESQILYKAISEQMIADMENSATTTKQQETLKEVKNLCENGMYFQALEKLLLADRD